MASILKPQSFKFDPDTVQHLDHLSMVYACTKTDILISLINAEYDKLQGNPELMKVINQMQELKATMEIYSNNQLGNKEKA